MALAVIFFLKAKDMTVFERYYTNRRFDGDQRKYIRLVQSLAEDFDLDLSNIWYSKEEMEEVAVEILAKGTRKFGDLYLLGRNGGIYTLHLPGTAFLILPAYWLDKTLFPNNPENAPEDLNFLPQKMYFTLAWLVVLSLISISLLFRFLFHLLESFSLVTGLFILLIWNSPFLYYSMSIYPDFPSLMFTLLALNAIFFPFKNKLFSKTFLILGIAWLPWLHQRYIPLALGLLVSFYFYRRFTGLSNKDFFVVFFALAILSLPYFYYFYFITGNPSPLSTSEAFGFTHAMGSQIPIGFFGLLFSRYQGCIWSYPWIILSLFGFYWGFKERSKLTIALFLAFFPYYLMASAGIPLGGGMVPAGRFLIAVFPFFLISAGKTLKNLSSRFSYTKLTFYMLFLLMLILNSKFFRVSMNYTMIKTNMVWVMANLLLLLSIYVLIYLGDRFLFEKYRFKNR